MESKLDYRILEKVKSNKKLSANDSLKLAEYAAFLFGESHTSSDLKRLGIAYLQNDKATVIKANLFNAKMKIRRFKDLTIEVAHTLSPHEMYYLRSDYRSKFSEILLDNSIENLRLMVSRLLNLQSIHN